MDEKALELGWDGGGVGRGGQDGWRYLEAETLS